MAEPLIERKELEALLFNVADMAMAMRSSMNSFFEEMTKADRERHKAFSEQMRKNIDCTRELAMAMRAEREAREQQQQAS